MKNEMLDQTPTASHPKQVQHERNRGTAGRRQRIIILLVVVVFCMTGTAFAKSPNASAASPAKNRRAALVVNKNGKAKNLRAKMTARKKSMSLIDKLASLAGKLGVNPDGVELARYAIKHPDHFASVVSHATAQDYPFFALVAAVKALRDKDLGNGLGTFTQAKCQSPITVIDVVFGKADTFIDNGKGKQDTNVVTGLAKEYAAQYAKEQAAAVKDQLIAELTQNIPYFGELKTICSFGFETNLQAERNIQDVVTEKAIKFQQAYQAFSDGNYGEGVAILLTLGADAGVACDFVDQAVSGGLLSRTPVLGSLVSGVCKSFAGKVIDGGRGIIKGSFGALESGYNAAADWGCTLYSLIGPGCSSAAPPPNNPTTNVINGAALWCQGRLGAPLNNIVINVPGQDYKFKCGDGSECEKKAGEPQKCVTAQEKAAWEASRKALLQLALQGSVWLKYSMPRDLMKITTQWAGSCPADVKCNQDINVATFEARATIEAAATANPTADYQTISWFPLQQANVKAAQAVRDSEFRVLPKRWAAAFNAIWLPKCKGEQECINNVTFIRGFVQVGVNGTHMSKPEVPHAVMSPIYAEAETAARNYFRSKAALLQLALQGAVGSKYSMPKDLSDIIQRNKECPTELRCTLDILAAMKEARATIEAAAAANPIADYQTISLFPLKQANLKAEQAVRDSEFRVLPKEWAAAFDAIWLPKCKGEQECINKVTRIRDVAQVRVTGAHKSKPEVPHAMMSPLYGEAETAARNYFRSKAVSTENSDRKPMINLVVRDATGREATERELAAYDDQLKNGRTVATVYADAVEQMNRNPRERAAMIARGYRAAYGREPKPGDLVFWQPQTASYKELIERERDFLYSPAGTQELTNAVMLKLFQKNGNRPTPREIHAAIETYKLRKMIFVEMF